MAAAKGADQLARIARVYATMPGGGARLGVYKDVTGGGIVGNGMAVIAKFATPTAARRALRGAGFVEMTPNAWKLDAAGRARYAANAPRAARRNAPVAVGASTFGGKRGTLISINVQEIVYQHRLAKHRGPYSHPFTSPGVELWGNPDGSLTIRHPRLRLWEDRIVSEDE